MPTIALALASLLPAPVLTAKTILTSSDVLSRPYASIVAEASLSRRQDDPSSDQQALLNPDGTLNMTAFSAATNDACRSALVSMPRASNPSGMSICFNLPSLNTQDGVFEADLRLYRVSQPRAAWTQVDIKQIDVNVGFPNAQVSSVTEDDFTGVGMVGELAARQEDNQADLPQLLQAYLLVGQINKSKMSQNNSMADLEALLMPSLNLTGPTPSRNLTTTISPNEAAFLTGVFSDKTPLSDFSAAQAAVDAQLRRLREAKGKDPDVAFVLPGTQILIFPIGLIITGTWTLLGFAVYGFGTVQRWRFREIYRERVRLLDTMGRKTGGI